MNNLNTQNVLLDQIRIMTSTVKETLDATFTDNGEKRLNQYSIHRILGSGSFGTVSLGVDTLTGRSVAVKEFSKLKLRKQLLQKGMMGRGRGRVNVDVASAANPINLIKGEIAILKKLKHKNVVSLYEVLDDPNHDGLFMIFEICENGTVIDIEAHKMTPPLPIPNAKSYFSQLILGIEYLHANNVVHRDIKVLPFLTQPDNLLLSSKNVVKIVDFGVSEFFSKDLQTMTKIAGTPAYYSPEMCACTFI